MDKIIARLVLIGYIIKQYSHSGLYVAGAELMIDKERFDKAAQCNTNIHCAMQKFMSL